jgi:2-amino-4-hydroxy-6-hydroxymethyldihydropteridine diphosphokinase
MRSDGVRRVVIGIGSNLGDRVATVRSAIQALAALAGVYGCAQSRLFETRPVGGPPQGDFVNAAMLLYTDCAAQQLLASAMRIEAEHGRVRLQANGPRTLDLDLLWIEGEQVQLPALQVPHPRLLQRAFALVPLLEVAPDARDPLTGERLADRLPRLSVEGIREFQEPERWQHADELSV